ERRWSAEGKEGGAVRRVVARSTQHEGRNAGIGSAIKPPAHQPAGSSPEASLLSEVPPANHGNCIAGRLSSANIASQAAAGLNMRLWLLLLILAVWAAMSANGASLSSLPAKKAIKKPPSVGCFKDKAKPRDLPKLARLGSVTPAACAAQCFKLRFSYAGVQNGNECRCGNSYGRHGRAQSSECNKPCNGSRVQTCGGFWRNLILKTGFKAATKRSPQQCAIDKRKIMAAAKRIYKARYQTKLLLMKLRLYRQRLREKKQLYQKFLQKMRLRYKARLQRRVQRFKKRIVKAKTRFGKKLRKINKRFQRKVMRKLKKKPLTKRRLRLVKRAFFEKDSYPEGRLK
uniref:WSC domain-containing protein n=2 Tax=Macrostomum lignano TaxID=282301 RepID=A0A1I8GNH5_9PLAT